MRSNQPIGLEDNDKGYLSITTIYQCSAVGTNDCPRILATIGYNDTEGCHWDGDLHGRSGTTIGLGQVGVDIWMSRYESGGTGFQP
jgi:hypothetical protein